LQAGNLGLAHSNNAAERPSRAKTHLSSRPECGSTESRDLIPDIRYREFRDDR
jgi:hypothetical protein